MSRTTIAAIVGAVALVAAAVALTLTGLPGAPKAASGPPNVLIILWDTVRADRLSMYGYEDSTTPRMAGWAKKYGVVYERAVSPAMWTVPSHASMFTGTAPTTHGAGFDHRHLDDHNHTLAEHFRDHGYQTYAFSANPNLSPRRVNLLQGFDHIEVSWGRRWRDKVIRHTRRKILKRDASTEISPANANRHRGTGFFNAGPITHEAFTQFLDRRSESGSDRPFFAYLSYMEAHKPRVPFLASRRKLSDKPTIQRGLQTDLTFNSQLKYSYGKMSYTDEELEAINAVYDATLIDLDEATADLLDELEARGVLDNTIVVFTSDHGEQLGEHQQFGHRAQVYQQLLHVPLVIAYPPKLEPGRVSTPVSNLDLYNTVIELAQLPKPDGVYKRGNLANVGSIVVEGLLSESISIDKLGFKKVQQHYDDLARDIWANKYRALTKGRYKVIETVDFDDDHLVDLELYDLHEDPFEEQDLAEQDPERAKALADELHTLHAALPKWNAADADEEEGGGGEMSLEQCKQLEALGYIEEGCEEQLGLASGEGEG